MAIRNPVSSAIRTTIAGTMSAQAATWYGKRLYRYFDRAEYAGAFAEGRFRISTLERCRRHENAQQGDAGEGSQMYSSGTFSSHQDGFKEVANRLSISFATGFLPADSMIRNSFAHTIMLDAYILCLTRRFDPEKFAKDFGEFCCEITDAAKFCDLVSAHLSTGWDQLEARLGEVRYRSRVYQGLEKFPHVALVKPSAYEWQEEVRMVWSVPHTGPLRLLDVNIPAVAPLCRRLR
jgi:hypothetical protein